MKRTTPRAAIPKSGGKMNMLAGLAKQAAGASGAAAVGPGTPAASGAAAAKPGAGLPPEIAPNSAQAKLAEALRMHALASEKHGEVLNQVHATEKAEEVTRSRIVKGFARFLDKADRANDGDTTALDTDINTVAGPFSRFIRKYWVWVLVASIVSLLLLIAAIVGIVFGVRSSQNKDEEDPPTL